MGRAWILRTDVIQPVGFVEMADLFTERRVADHRARALPFYCIIRSDMARVRFALALFLFACSLSACSSSVPSIGDKSAVSPAPGAPYTPPRGVVPAEPDSSKTRASLPPDLAAHDTSLALP